MTKYFSAESPQNPMPTKRPLERVPADIPRDVRGIHHPLQSCSTDAHVTGRASHTSTRGAPRPKQRQCEQKFPYTPSESAPCSFEPPIHLPVSVEQSGVALRPRVELPAGTRETTSLYHRGIRRQWGFDPSQTAVFVYLTRGDRARSACHTGCSRTSLQRWVTSRVFIESSRRIPRGLTSGRKLTLPFPNHTR